MSTATITYVGDMRTECVHNASGSKITTDLPVDNKGQGRFFSPSDLCATSLAACGLSIMAIYAEKHNIDIKDTKVDVTKTMGIAPRRITKLEVIFTMPKKDYSEEHKKGLENEVLNCPVCYSLHPEVERIFKFNW